MSATSSLSTSRLKSLAEGLKQASTKLPPTSLALAVIDRNPEQPRQHFDEDKLAQLAESIKARGVIQPILVRPVSSGRYQIVVGERRWRAAQLARLKEIPVVVQTLNDADALAAALIENIDREDMIPADEVVAVARLAKETSVQEAAVALGKTPTWVSKRKRIAEGAPFVREFLESRATSDIEALYELAKLAEDEPDRAQQIVASFKPGEHLRDRLRTASKELKSPAPAAPALERAPAPGLDDENAEDDDDAELEPRLRASGAGSREPSLSHAKGRAALGGDDDTADGGEEDSDAGPAPTRAASKPKALSVVGVRGKKGRLVLLTAAGDEVPCEFNDEALGQLARIIGR